MRIGRNGLVQYLVNSLPVNSHAKHDNGAFRYITSNFIYQGLCRNVDIKRDFGVSEDSVSRALKKFETKGETGFFGPDVRHGKAHKIVGGRRDRREKIQRLEARFFPLVQLAIDQPLDDLPAITIKQIGYNDKIEFYRKKEEELKTQRSQIKPRLKISQMPQQHCYNKLKTESKLLMKVIRMICYRAESSVAQWITPYLVKADNEKRMVIKQIIQSNADLTPDYDNKTLTVTLHSLSANRFNEAAGEITKLHNRTETIFPGTDLK